MKPIPNFAHPIYPVLQQRWSPRAFSEQMLSKADVSILLEAARWAASCMNEQPWRFVWAFNDDSPLYNKLFDCLLKGNQEWVSTAPVLMLTLVEPNFHSNGKPNPWARHDLGLAIGNMTTQASSMGIYIHNMGGFSAQKVQAHFPQLQDLDPVTMIALGYPGDIASLSEYNQKREQEVQTRKPQTEIDLSSKLS
jgi:nitroreductase